MMNPELLSQTIQDKMILNGFVKNQYTDFKPLADAIAQAVIEHIQTQATVTENGGVS